MTFQTKPTYTIKTRFLIDEAIEDFFEQINTAFTSPKKQRKA